MNFVINYRYILLCRHICHQYVISIIMYKNHISVLTGIKSKIVVYIRYACFSIFIKCFFFQQKHVYLYIIELFTGYDDDSKLNVTRDSNYFTMKWKSEIVKKKTKTYAKLSRCLEWTCFYNKT